MCLTETSESTAILQNDAESHENRLSMTRSSHTSTSPMVCIAAESGELVPNLPSPKFTLYPYLLHSGIFSVAGKKLNNAWHALSELKLDIW